MRLRVSANSDPPACLKGPGFGAGVGGLVLCMYRTHKFLVQERVRLVMQIEDRM